MSSIFVTGVGLIDTDASHSLILKAGSNLTADRIVTITTGDAARILTLAGDATISGTNTGDQDLSTYLTAAAALTDNAIVRGDGGVRGVQTGGTTPVSGVGRVIQGSGRVSL